MQVPYVAPWAQHLGTHFIVLYTRPFVQGTCIQGSVYLKTFIKTHTKGLFLLKGLDTRTFIQGRPLFDHVLIVLYISVTMTLVIVKNATMYHRISDLQSRQKGKSMDNIESRFKIQDRQRDV